MQNLKSQHTTNMGRVDVLNFTFLLCHIQDKVYAFERLICSLAQGHLQILEPSLSPKMSYGILDQERSGLLVFLTGILLYLEIPLTCCRLDWCFVLDTFLAI